MYRCAHGVDEKSLDNRTRAPLRGLGASAARSLPGARFDLNFGNRPIRAIPCRGSEARPRASTRAGTAAPEGTTTSSPRVIYRGHQRDPPPERCLVQPTSEMREPQTLGHGDLADASATTRLHRERARPGRPGSIQCRTKSEGHSGPVQDRLSFADAIVRGTRPTWRVPEPVKISAACDTEGWHATLIDRLRSGDFRWLQSLSSQPLSVQRLTSARPRPHDWCLVSAHWPSAAHPPRPGRPVRAPWHTLRRRAFVPTSKGPAKSELAVRSGHERT